MEKNIVIVNYVNDISITKGNKIHIIFCKQNSGKFNKTFLNVRQTIYIFNI